MNWGAVATPEVLVVIVTVLNPPVNVPPGPLAGAVKITGTPLARLPPASFTVACISTANVLPMVADCPDPAVAAIWLGGPARFVRA